MAKNPVDDTTAVGKVRGQGDSLLAACRLAQKFVEIGNVEGAADPTENGECLCDVLDTAIAKAEERGTEQVLSDLHNAMVGLDQMIESGKSALNFRTLRVLRDAKKRMVEAAEAIGQAATYQNRLDAVKGA